MNNDALLDSSSRIGAPDQGLTADGRAAIAQQPSNNDTARADLRDPGEDMLDANVWQGRDLCSLASLAQPSALSGVAQADAQALDRAADAIVAGLA
jgi:hypothetical protein